MIVCSGKVYYDLAAYRRENKIADIAIIRLEQQYPFPHADFKAADREVPERDGSRLVPGRAAEPGRLVPAARLPARRHRCHEQVLAYAGRPISASPAVGYMSKHIAQQKQLVADAFAAELASGEMVTGYTDRSEV